MSNDEQLEFFFANPLLSKGKVTILGNSVPFAPCPGSHCSNYLLGSAIYVERPFLATHLGIYSYSEGGEVVASLYREENKRPSTLIAFTDATPLVLGSQLIPILIPPVLLNKNYWFMAVYSSDTKIGKSAYTWKSRVFYTKHNFGKELPNIFPGPGSSVYEGESFNYWIVGSAYHG